MTLFEFVVIGGIAILLYVVRAWLPSYISEKAKNTAQAEDIGRLTELVKEVETKFETKTEILKAQLDMTTQMRIGMHNEVKAALIKIHSSLYEYFNLLSDHTLENIDDYDNVEINKYLSKIISGGTNLLTQRAYISIFVDDEDVIEEARKILQHLFDNLRPHTITWLRELKKNNIEAVNHPENYELHRRGRNAIDEKFDSSSREHIEIASQMLLNYSYMLKRFFSEKTTFVPNNF